MLAIAASISGNRSRCSCGIYVPSGFFPFVGLSAQSQVRQGDHCGMSSEVIGVRGKSPLADCMIIADFNGTGRRAASGTRCAHWDLAPFQVGGDLQVAP